MELNDEIYERITDLSSEGDEFADAGNFGKAIERYSEALKLIPEPKYDWEASTWLYVAIGDAYYLDDIDSAKTYFETILQIDSYHAPALAYMGKLSAEDMNYLRATKINLGLLVNFGHYPGVEIKRIAL